MTFPPPAHKRPSMAAVIKCIGSLRRLPAVPVQVDAIPLVIVYPRRPISERWKVLRPQRLALVDCLERSFHAGIVVADPGEGRAFGRRDRIGVRVGVHHKVIVLLALECQKIGLLVATLLLCLKPCEASGTVIPPTEEQLEAVLGVLGGQPLGRASWHVEVGEGNVEPSSLHHVIGVEVKI